MIKQFFILLYYYLHIVIGTWQLFFSNVDKYGVGLDHTYIHEGVGGRGGYKENGGQFFGFGEGSLRRGQRVLGGLSIDKRWACP